VYQTLPCGFVDNLVELVFDPGMKVSAAALLADMSLTGDDRH